MKACYIFICALVVLLAVACRNEEAELAVTTISSQPSGETYTSSTVPNISLDSFQRTVTATLPGTLRAPAAKNKFLIRRTNDSLMVSGIAFATGEKNARAAYHFYFKADGKGCYAYLKQDFSSPMNGIEQHASREIGYCLHFFNTAG